MIFRVITGTVLYQDLNTLIRILKKRDTAGKIVLLLYPLQQAFPIIKGIPDLGRLGISQEGQTR